MKSSSAFLGGRVRSLVLLAVIASLGPGAGAAGAQAENVERYQYLSPVPGSKLVSPRNNIAIRPGPPIDGASIDAGALVVRGTRSGRHGGALILSDDGNTLVFEPEEPFALGEQVAVRLEPGMRTLDGGRPPALAFTFEVSTVDPKRGPPIDLAQFYPHLAALRVEPEAPLPAQIAAAPTCDTLPAGYPPVFLITSDNPDPGHVFLAPFTGPVQRGHLLILDNQGQPIFYRRTPRRVFDFKMQPNGLLTYIQDFEWFRGLDSTYTVVDSFQMGNGYFADVHELQVLSNGHALMMSYDVQPVDMSVVVPGGNPNANVVGLVIQEVDADNNVVFQWRSWDHFEITDADTCLVDLRAAQVDYVHGNAIEPDADGNILISSRHLNEITKIDRNTGDVMWRLGLNAKNNEFAFTNDTRGWNAQHDIRRLPNGNITLFDNGNCQDTLYSRPLEYHLEETGLKSATLVWAFDNTPHIYGPFMGNVQRLDTGHTMIAWGGAGPDPKVSEVRADGSVAFELGFKSLGTWTYRAFRFPWDRRQLAASPTLLDFGTVARGDTATLPLEIGNESASDFTLTCLSSTHGWFEADDPMALVIPAGDTVTASVRFIPGASGDVSGTLYARSVGDSDLVAEPLATLVGRGEGITAVGGGPRSGVVLHATHPNPFADATTIRFDLAEPGRVTLEVFDLHGRKVDTLVDGFLGAGRHETAWRAGQRPNGVYFYRLALGDVVLTRRVARIR